MTGNLAEMKQKGQRDCAADTSILEEQYKDLYKNLVYTNYFRGEINNCSYS